MHTYVCMYVHTLRNKIMTAPPYSCDKLIMAIQSSTLGNVPKWRKK